MSCIRDNKFDSAYELYLTGLSLAQVAGKIGSTRQILHKAFKRRGLQLRGPNFQPEQWFDGKKFTLRPNGYYCLTTDDREYIHRYIWEYYNGPIPEGWDVHHLDEDKAHNELSNYECLPKPEHTAKYSPHNNQFGKGGREIIMMDTTGNEIKRFKKTSVAAKELGIDMSTINSAIRGLIKTAAGYKWKYA